MNNLFVNNPNLLFDSLSKVDNDNSAYNKVIKDFIVNAKKDNTIIFEIDNLLRKYHPKKLALYKKIIDTMYQEDIKLFEIICPRIKGCKDENSAFTPFNIIGIMQYGLKKYKIDNIFNFDEIIPKHQNITNQKEIDFYIEILPYITKNDNHFNVYYKTFKNYYESKNLKDSKEEQFKIKKVFDFFELNDENKHKVEEFYPLLIENKQFVELATDDDLFTKRLSFDISNHNMSIKKMNKNNFEYIYNIVLDNLKEKNCIDDKLIFEESDYFYIYLMSKNKIELNYISDSIKQMNEYLKTKMVDLKQNEYYIKLFDSIYLNQITKNNSEIKSTVKKI